MDNSEKFVRKLGVKRSLRVRVILAMIAEGTTDSLDVKKLEGIDSVYRVRAGNVRIKFMKTVHGNIIVGIGFRNENTY